MIDVNRTKCSHGIWSGQELRQNSYTTRRPVTEKCIRPECLIYPADEFKNIAKANETFWTKEPDQNIFAQKWEDFLKPISLAVMAAEKTLLIHRRIWTSHM